MAENLIYMKWKRPDSVEYPKVWHRFKARDLNSDELVEYRIEDLTEDRAEESYQHMRDNYLAGEPVTVVLGGSEDLQHCKDYVFAWKSIMAQKMPLVCYKEGSREIIGANFTFVTHKDDHFVEHFSNGSKSQITKDLLKVVLTAYEQFDPCEKYGVDQYLSSFGLSVDKKYRGRGIGDQFLDARKFLCKEFNLPLTHTVFSSDFSNRNADKVGFKTDVFMKYDEIQKRNPDLNLSGIKSSGICTKTKLY